MKMLKSKNVLKLSMSVIFASAFACQAFAGDIALTGSYGNYLQPGCGWVVGSSNSYGPTNVPSGSTTNFVTVDTTYLICGTNTAPQAVKAVVTNYEYTVPNFNTKRQTGQTCSINPAQASAVGTCASYRVYN